MNSAQFFSTPIKFTNDENTMQFNFVLGDDEYQVHHQLADDEYLPGEILDIDALGCLATILIIPLF